MSRLKTRYYGLEDRTHICGNRWRRLVNRGEKPIELGDSWFSAKSIEVERVHGELGGRALVG